MQLILWQYIMAHVGISALKAAVAVVNNMAVIGPVVFGAIVAPCLF